MFRRRMIIGSLAVLAWGIANVGAWVYLERRDLQVRAQAADVPYDVIRRFQERRATITDENGHIEGSLPYQLFRPSGLKSDRLYPVILFLHGSGERGDDNLRQVRGIPGILTEPDLQRDFPCFIVAPQCPAKTHWSDRAHITGRSANDGLTVALAAVDDILASDQADPDQVYLIGYSMGGFGAWELAARAPDRFAAVVPIAGSGDPVWAEQLLDARIWAIHGSADTVVPVEQSRDMIAAIRDLGGTPRYDELVGSPHACWRALLAEPQDFMRALRELSR